MDNTFDGGGKIDNTFDGGGKIASKSNGNEQGKVQTVSTKKRKCTKQKDEKSSKEKRP